MTAAEREQMMLDWMERIDQKLDHYIECKADKEETRDIRRLLIGVALLCVGELIALVVR